MKWISIEKQMPPENTNIMLYYNKGKKSTYGGKLGGFVVQGYLFDEAKRLAKVEDGLDAQFWRDHGRGLTFFDYTERQIQSLMAKKSTNKVTHWAKMPTLPSINKL